MTNTVSRTKSSGSSQTMPAALTSSLQVPKARVESWQVLRQTSTGALYVVRMKEAPASGPASQHGSHGRVTKFREQAANAPKSQLIVIGTGSLSGSTSKMMRQIAAAEHLVLEERDLLDQANVARYSPEHPPVEMAIEARYEPGALTDLPSEDLDFAAEIWPVLQPRTEWRPREQFFQWLVDREIAAGKTEEKAMLDTFARFRRWSKKNAVLSVNVHGEHFPKFQFGDDSEPLPVIAKLNATWPARTSGVAKAAWLLSPNPNLGGAIPADLLRTEPQRVVETLELEQSIVH